MIWPYLQGKTNRFVNSSRISAFHDTVYCGQWLHFKNFKNINTNLVSYFTDAVYIGEYILKTAI